MAENKYVTRSGRVDEGCFYSCICHCKWGANAVDARAGLLTGKIIYFQLIAMLQLPGIGIP
jgi:hypothetical protein